MAAELAVIVPSWNAERAYNLCWDLIRHERRGRVEYIVVGCPAPSTMHPNLKPIVRFIETAQSLSPVEAMALGAEQALSDPTNKLLVFLHDDVELDLAEKPEQHSVTGDPFFAWDTTIRDHFNTHQRCGLAGFGGALGLADPDIYKLPYELQQLARRDFVSNMRDAHLHGRRVDRPVRVAALDGFSLIVSREFYKLAGGALALTGAWDACLVDGIPFHMYDAWLSSRAAELGYETWMLPFAVHHAGGATSVGNAQQYRGVVERLGYRSEQDLFERAHERVYERFARVLPLEAKP